MYGWTKQRLVERSRDGVRHFVDNVRTGAQIGVWVKKLLEGLYVVAFTDGYTQALKDQAEARQRLAKNKRDVFRA